MPNLAICVNNCDAGPAGKMNVGLRVSVDSTNESLGTNVTIDFASSSTQINSAIIAKAKQEILTSFGITIAGSDTVKLFGGAV